MGKIEKNTLVVITKEKMETIGVVKSKAGGTVWQVNLFGYPDYMTHGFEERAYSHLKASFRGFGSGVKAVS